MGPEERSSAQMPLDWKGRDFQPRRVGQIRSRLQPLRDRPYFLNKFSNAARASLGRWLAGVEVSFSRVTRIS